MRFTSLAATIFLAAFTAGFDADEKDATGCPKVFQGKCHCNKQRYHFWKPDVETFVVNCTNTRFNNTEMLEFLPDGVEVLLFSGNQIPVLDWNLFGIWDEHPKLEVIDLTNNGIREIAGKTFHKVGNVRRLVLDHNDLIISGPQHHPRIFSNFFNLEQLHLTNAFTETIDSQWYLRDLKNVFSTSNMTNLKKLHLEQNEIWSINDFDMFCPLVALEELYLGDNQLQGVEFDIQCLRNLRHLDLEYNKIRRFPNSTLRTFDRVFGSDNSEAKQLNLKGNAFRCDCHLKNFAHWLQETDVQFYHKEEIRCYDGYPKIVAGRRVLNIGELQCDPNAASKDSATAAAAAGQSVTHGLLVVLILTVLAVGALVIYYHRKRMHDKLKPLVESLQKSMQYKTIEREDEQPEINV